MTTRTQGIVMFVAAAFLALVIPIGLLLREHGPGNMGTGFLQGAAVGLAATVVMLWRVVRGRGSTFERAWTQSGDERDDALLTRALADLGALAFPLTAAAGIAIGLGAYVPMVLFLLLVSQVAVLAVAFAVRSRRG